MQPQLSVAATGKVPEALAASPHAQVPDASIVRLLSACSVPHAALVFRSHHHFIYSTRCVVTGGAKQYVRSPRRLLEPLHRSRR